jgi:hypothetical protein
MDKEKLAKFDHTGKKRSQETRDKISQAQKGKKRGNYKPRVKKDSSSTENNNNDSKE